MAKSKAVLAVLATAVALAGTIDNAELNTSIEALKAETDANGNTQEYKDLKELLGTIEAQGDDDGAGDEDGANDGTDGDAPKGDDGVTGDGEDANAKTPKEDKTPKPASKDGEAQGDAPVEPKKYDYAGVRMIGSKWYCDKDKYKKGFGTANECAEHFNG